MKLFFCLATLIRAEIYMNISLAWKITQNGELELSFGTFFPLFFFKNMCILKSFLSETDRI